MKLQDIKHEISRVMNIATLNPMQGAVAASDARRLILIAPTGSGKTLAFAIALLKRISDYVTGVSPRAVVIAPSRELVQQIFNVIRPLATGLKVLALYGGNAFAAEESSIRGAIPDIVVATPGRLLDHINRQTIDVGESRMLVLDEYDKTLELGFHDEMKKIIRRTGERRPKANLDFVMLTSATRLDEMPKFVGLDSAEIIDLSSESDIKKRLRIVNVPSPGKDKLDTLAALVRSIPAGPIIVFVNHRESAERVWNGLKSRHISAALYHGGLDQQNREKALAVFAAGGARVLVATDLAGRGIDIDSVEAVIHYHPAINAETWTHRNGRTARVDKTGTVYVISAPDELQPEFVTTENDYYPDMTADFAVRAPMTVLYLDLGKRDKVSKGDIAGFLMKQAGLGQAEVGKISIFPSYSLVAIAPDRVRTVMDASKTARLKNKRVRVSLA
ncbi:MAG: DEAD/DEAH box helicase [Muribaculaceae bacterium]|nr:DEAD/DEAH box helicase [Muribaculaceae bacterium]